MKTCYHWHIHDYGNAGTGAKNLTMLHGFMGSGADWLGLAPRLGASWRLLCPDLPGHGGAGKLPDAATFPEVAAELASDLDAMGVPPCPLAGYSMGGRLALYLTLTYPGHFTHLILESASPGIADETDRAARHAADESLAQRLEAMSPTGFVAFLEEWHSSPLFASLAGQPEVKKMLIARRAENAPSRLAASLRGMGAGSQPNLWPRLLELAVPTLCIAGERDEKFRAIGLEMARQNSGINILIIPGASHNTHLEAPAVFARALTDFLAGG